MEDLRILSLVRNYSICKIPHQLLKLRIQSEDCYQQVTFHLQAANSRPFCRSTKGCGEIFAVIVMMGGLDVSITLDDAAVEGD